MITHNGKYLLHATHHGMPIYAATMGGKMVIGGWLLSATLQAIVAAFGAVEGGEVIVKTNDYLNAIAATDPARAQRLAGFINEDPLLVTSLVETSKTRWLVGDGKSWIEVAFPITTDDYIKWVEDNKETSSSFQPIFATAPTYTYAHWINNTKGIFAIGGQESGQFDLSQGVHIVEKKADKWFLDGVQKQQRTMAYTKYDSFKLFDWCGSTSRASNSAMQMFQIGELPTLLLAPCYTKAQGNGMLDIISGTFYPNANTQGSFTIALTDKQPTQ